MRQRRLLTALIAFALAAPLSAAPLLVNGGFEIGTGIAATFSDGFIRCYANGTCQLVGSTGETGTGGIQGWAITGEVDYIGSHWTAAEGSRSVDLVGGPGIAGGISQTFDSVSGQLYLLTFYLSGNFDGGVALSRTVNVQAPGVNQDFQFDKPVGWSHSAMGWVQWSVPFIASGATSTVMFSAGANDGYGPVIDNVSVTAIPEPASMLLLGAGIFALAGLARYRRKR